MIWYRFTSTANRYSYYVSSRARTAIRTLSSSIALRPEYARSYLLRSLAHSAAGNRVASRNDMNAFHRWSDARTTHSPAFNAHGSMFFLRECANTGASFDFVVPPLFVSPHQHCPHSDSRCTRLDRPTRRRGSHTAVLAARSNARFRWRARQCSHHYGRVPPHQGAAVRSSVGQGSVSAPTRSAARDRGRVAERID